jgi:ribonuclease HI
MPVAAPHYLLLAESRRRHQQGDWRFVLKTPDGQKHFEASDAEPATGEQRLELLAVVRGLEALEQPSRVTLLTRSSYISRGLNYGLDEWRENAWHWERHGQMVPVKDGDLWRRLDRALSFHRLECRKWRADRADGPQVAPAAATVGSATDSELDQQRNALKIIRDSRTNNNIVRKTRSRTLLAMRKRLRNLHGLVRLRLAQFGTGLLPRPWLE